MVRRLIAVGVAGFLLSGCSIKKVAVNKLGNALASGGTTFESDDDPDLVGSSLPFALKLMESLLAESPRHPGLLLAVTSGFTEYSYAFVGLPAERAAAESVEQGSELRNRARRLYLRAHGYGMRALEARYPGFGAALESPAQTALARVRKRDVPMLYWTAAALGLAISVSQNDTEMLAQLPTVQAFIRRALELDEAWNEGALPEFLIEIESARLDVSPDQRRLHIRGYYDQALRLSGGRRASLFVSYAQNACVPAQDRAQFLEALDRALKIDPNQHPETRLANLIAQRRARWLLSRAEDLFLAAPGDKED